jgi:hypothetical protein
VNERLHFATAKVRFHVRFDCPILHCVFEAFKLYLAPEKAKVQLPIQNYWATMAN